MKTSESIDKLAPALLAAQSQIGNATKNAKNPHFRNNYADLGSVIDAVKEPLNKAGIAILQSLSEGADGLHLTTRLLHTSGQFIEDTAFTPLPKNDPQGVGSATTYLRRYSLCAILCISQGDGSDDDGVAAMPAKPAPAPAKPKAEAPKPANDDPF
jgi:hypothetical protein